MKEDDRQRELPREKETICLESKEFSTEVVIETDPEEKAA
jgi:hypothetical protein